MLSLSAVVSIVAGLSRLFVVFAEGRVGVTEADGALLSGATSLRLSGSFPVVLLVFFF